MTFKFLVNNDTVDSPYGTSGIDWTEVSAGNDKLIFTAGSTVVADGQGIPSETDLNQAGIILTGSQIIVSKYLLEDISDSLLKEIHNMGNQNKRYVLAFDFDDETASEPVLEVWDDLNLNTIISQALGSGVPSSSWYVGVVTTDGMPGTNWIGTTLSGSSNGHFLWLNNENGALTGAKTLYANLKIVIPASATSGAFTPVMVVKYASV